MVSHMVVQKYVYVTRAYANKFFEKTSYATSGGRLGYGSREGERVGSKGQSNLSCKSWKIVEVFWKKKIEVVQKNF